MFVNHDQIMRRLLEELADAQENTSAFISPEQGFATIEEKVNEMKNSIEGWDHGQSVKDAFGVAASAIKFIQDTYKFRLPSQHFQATVADREFSIL